MKIGTFSRAKEDENECKSSVFGIFGLGGE